MAYRMGRGFGDYQTCVSTGPCSAAEVTQSQSLGGRFGGPLNLPSSAAPTGKVWVVTPAGNALVDQATVAQLMPYYASGFFIPDLGAVLGNSSLLTTLTTGWGANTDIRNAAALGPPVPANPTLQQPPQAVVSAAPPPAKSPGPTTFPLIYTGGNGQPQDMTGGTGFSLSSIPWWGWLIAAGAGAWAVSKA